jgi:flagellar protein FliS
MNHNSSENYLVNEVMTASPEKLHLLLLDAVIRECRRACKHLESKEEKEASDCILRAQRIMIGIIGGIDFSTKSDLVARVSQVYLFICKTLTQAYTQSNKEKLADALRVLEIERETWRQLCEKLAESRTEWKPTQSGHAPPAPIILAQDNVLSDLPGGSFSLEA